MQRRQLLQTASMGAALGALGLSGKAIAQSGPKVVVVGGGAARRSIGRGGFGVSWLGFGC